MTPTHVVRGWRGGLLVLLLLVSVSSARPSQDSDGESWQPVSGHRVNRPLFRDVETQRERKSQESKAKPQDPQPQPASSAVHPPAESVNSGRSESTSPTPIGESVKMVTKQLLQSPEATDMVATDVRTPPKIKTHSEELVSLGKGEAIPLDTESIHSYQVATDTHFVKPSTAESTPASGISTWILLNNGEQSTQASQKKQTKPLTVVPTQVPPKKKVSKPSQEVVKASENIKNITAMKLENKQAAVITKVENPKKTQQSVNQEPLVKIPALMLQDAKFKNKTPVVVGRVPSTVATKIKPENSIPIKKVEVSISPVSIAKIEPLAPQAIRRKVPTTTTTTTTPAPTPATVQSAKPVFQYELVPTTSVVVHTDIVEAETTEEVATTEIPTTTTKRTRKPTKKKKKNKNRRRRPAKKPEGEIESKITEENNSTRIGPNGKPLSTRIYNYLSREIMPSVGVGLVGLVLTAGLAGLLLYPFGGGVPIPVRRNYEKGSPDGHMYYYNDYNNNAEVDNGQPEETVFSQVLAGMTQSDNNKYEKYPRPATAAPSTHYSSGNKYRYDPSHEYGYQSAYQNKDKYSSLTDASARNPEGYSTLPDSASLSSKYNPSYSVSGSQYSAPSSSAAITQYTDPKYSSPVSSKLTTGYSSDGKYSSSVDSSGVVSGVQYDSTKYSPPIDSTGSADTTKTKYSTLTGLSIESQASKYSPDDQSLKYLQSSKYTSLTDESDKYHQSPKYTSLTDNQSTKYSSLTDTKYSDDQSSKYPASAEYTAYSNPSDIGTSSGTYSSTNHKQAVYSDIEYDDTKSLPSITEEDKSDKSQPTFSALHSSDDFSNVDSMSMFSGSYSNEVRHRQGVLAVEHGPRSIKLNRKKRQVDEKHNEVDGSLPDEQTTTERTESTTEIPSTVESSSTSHENTAESTTWSMPKEPEFTTPSTSPHDQGFFAFVRRLAQMKLRMGLELLRSTTHAVARYLDTVQKRMGNVVRDMDKKNVRQRRNIFKKML